MILLLCHSVTGLYCPTTTTSVCELSMFVMFVWSLVSLSTSIFSAVSGLSCLSVFFLGIFGIGTCGWVGGGFSGSRRLPGVCGLALGGLGCPFCNKYVIESAVRHLG